MENVIDLNYRHFENFAEGLNAKDKGLREVENLIHEGEIAVNGSDYNGPNDTIESERQNILDVRMAIAAMGLSPSSIDWMNSDEASREGGKTAVGSFHTGSKKISLQYDGLVSIAENHTESLREATIAVLEHEIRHKQSDAAEGSDECNATLIDLFGQEAVHNTEEAMARKGTTEHFDAYKQEEQMAIQYAGKLRISTASLLDIKLKGDHKKLTEAAVSSGLYPKTQTQPGHEVMPPAASDENYVPGQIAA